MRATGIRAPAPDAALAALFVPFESSGLALPADGRVLFLRARAGLRLREMAQPAGLCEQSFMPFADELARQGLRVGEPDAGRAICAGAGAAAAPARRGTRLVCACSGLAGAGRHGVGRMPNAEGAKSGEGDLTRLAGAVQHLSKHKCRVFWATPESGRCRSGAAGAMAGAGCATHDRRWLHQSSRLVRLGSRRPCLRVAGERICRRTCTGGWRIWAPAMAISPAS